MVIPALQSRGPEPRPQPKAPGSSGLMAQTRTTTASESVRPGRELREHRFLVLVQNLSARRTPVSFHLEGLPFARVNYSPALARGVAPGMAISFQLSVTPPAFSDSPGLFGSGSRGPAGEYRGAVVLQGGDGCECGRCPVYLRVVAPEEAALAAPGQLLRSLPAGSLSLRAHLGDGELERAALAPVPPGQATFRSMPESPAVRRCAELVAPLDVPAAGGSAAAVRDALLLSPSSKRARRPAVMRPHSMAPLATPLGPTGPLLSWRVSGSGGGSRTSTFGIQCSTTATPRVENRLAI